MKSPTAIKNERAQKVKNTHMKSIMNEVKNKSIMDQLQVNEKCNDFDITQYNPHIRIWRNSRIPRKTINAQKQNLLLNPNKNIKTEETVGQIQQQKRGEEQISGQEKQNYSRKNQQNSYRQRKSSRMQLQLNQIIKYTALYPSRTTSKNKIQKALNKLQHKITSKIQQKSIFSTQKSQYQKQQQKKQNNNKYTRFQKFCSDQNMFLNLVQPSLIFQTFDLNKQHNAKYLIKKSKNILSKSKIKNDLHFSGFIENQLVNLKYRKQRKTAFITINNENIQNCKSVDVTMENMQKVHEIFRGDCRYDEQISGYITTQEVNKFHSKYDTYRNIYNRSKQGLNGQKLDLGSINKLTVRNAVFLNQALMQSNNRGRKLQIEATMRKLNFYN